MLQDPGSPASIDNNQALVSKRRPVRKTERLNLRISPVAKQRLEVAAESMNLPQSVIVSAARDLFLALPTEKTAEAMARWMYRQAPERGE